MDIIGIVSASVGLGVLLAWLGTRDLRWPLAAYLGAVAVWLSLYVAAAWLIGNPYGGVVGAGPALIGYAVAAWIIRRRTGVDVAAPR